MYHSEDPPLETISTPVTRLFGIKYPVILAGMNKAAGSTLAAAITNAGGLGVIGGVNCSPRILRTMISTLKRQLDDPNAPFGVDLLIPKVGGSARKTNYDYTKGQLNELIDIIIQGGAKLFVCAVGVPPIEVVKKLHDAGILVMNMVGAPKHVPKALAVGVDLICCQGGEGGGHTGDIATTILLPACVDLCRGHVSPMTGEPVYVVGAGGIYDGRGLAMALSYGAQAVWVGTRFVASVEAGASDIHKQEIVKAGVHDTYRSLVYTGRPLRVIKNKYADAWEEDQEKMKELLEEGIIPHHRDEKLKNQGVKPGPGNHIEFVDDPQSRLLVGQVCGVIDEILPARVILYSMVKEAVRSIRGNVQKIEMVSSKL